MKEHKIVTITDIFQAVNSENVIRFLDEFIPFIFNTIEMKKEFPDIESFGFNWTDDGNNETTGILINNQLSEFKK